MTVQEMIDELSKIRDKSRTVLVMRECYAYPAEGVDQIKMTQVKRGVFEGCWEYDSKSKTKMIVI